MIVPMTDIHLGNRKNCCGSSQDHNETDTQLWEYVVDWIGSRLFNF